MQRNYIQSTVRGAALIVVLLLWLLVSPTTAFFWTLFIVWAVFRLDSRMIGIGALVLLVLIPITLSFKRFEGMSEQLAIYVFFLFCITVALQILELRHEPKERQAKPFTTGRETEVVTMVSAKSRFQLPMQLPRRAPRTPKPQETTPAVSAPPISVIKPVKKKVLLFDIPRRKAPKKKF